MNPANEVNRLLRDSGATLKRDSKHIVWQLPNGKNFVQASTPGDYRAAANQLTDLRRLLGIVDPSRGQAGERREHKHRPGNLSPARIHAAPAPDGVMAQKLIAAGAVELALRRTIEQQSAEIERMKQEKERPVEVQQDAQRVNGAIITGAGAFLAKKTCRDCNETKPVTCFQKIGVRNKPGVTIRIGVCNECLADRREAGRRERKQAEAEAIAAKSRFTCGNCGAEKEPGQRSAWKKAWCRDCAYDVHPRHLAMVAKAKPSIWRRIFSRLMGKRD